MIMGSGCGPAEQTRRRTGASARNPALVTGAIFRQPAVIGREREIAVVSAFLDFVPRGPRALLVEGEAGIGKSTVWFESVRLAEARGYDDAVAAYRLSAQAGNPLSERKLAQMFGRTSRRRARARIAEARRAPSSPLTEDPAITVGAQSQ
jgi:hypothetical protein